MAHHIVPEAEAILDKQFKVLDHGFVILTDYMGSDAAVVQAARVSLAGEGTRPGPDDQVLNRYLMRQRHTSPFEMVELKFHCAMPIFVARQWIRHRTANVNEMSGRYSELPELTYVPEVEQIKYQSPLNKQGRGDVADRKVAECFRDRIADRFRQVFDDYRAFLGKGHSSVQDVFPEEDFEDVKANGGISRELARINLPVATYTQWYWKIDLHNLLHFLSLRLDPHAQWEIRQYAEVMAKMVQALCPISWKAFEDYRLNALQLSAPEIEALHLLQHMGTSFDVKETRLSKREVEEFRTKLIRLRLDSLVSF